MPIVIQDLLASDTLSQAVDKINFNFDQLILNGGGPVGPLGPPGPTGPAGGRGPKGATWYKDNTTAPGSNPNSLIIVGVNEDDYFLQSNGQVWQYNGTVWVQTVINLLGPQGTPGIATGFSYAGGFPGGAGINNQNSAYLVPMPGGILGGANQVTNQGISTVLFGAVASNANPPAGITFNSAFQIPDTMTESLDSSVVTMLVHQKDSASSAIKFMGGGVDSADKYEQNILTNLSNVSLGIDDSFNINVPKAATSPSAISDLIGFNLNTLRKGQQFYSGKQITFITGADPLPSGLPTEISDVNFTINTSNPTSPAKFVISTTFASANALFEIGGNIIIPTTTSRTGSSLIEAGQIGIVGGTNIIIRRSATQFASLSSAGIRLNDQDTIVHEITGVSNTVLIQYGAGITIPNSTIRTGKALIETGEIGLVANQIRLNRGVFQFISITPSGSVINDTIQITSQVTAGSTARIQLGTASVVSNTSDKTGTALIDANVINLLGNQLIRIGRSDTQFIDISNSNGIRLTGDTFLFTPPTNAAAAQALVRNTSTGRVETMPGFPLMPFGGIIMWSGNPTSLPTGWYLCNGQFPGITQAGAVTPPDLRGRFIVGYDERLIPPLYSSTEYNTVGNVGGLRQIQLNAQQLPQHSHAYKDTMFTEELVFNPGVGQLAYINNRDQMQGVKGRNAGTDTNGNQVFSYSTNRSTQLNVTSNDPFDNRPPYYVLAYIIYLGEITG